MPQLKEPSWHRDVHRTAAVGMTTARDPQAERIKARKARKTALRHTMRTDGIAAAARLFLSTANVIAATPDEECRDCLTLQRRPTTRTTRIAS